MSNNIPDVTLLRKIINCAKEAADNFIKPIIRKFEDESSDEGTTLTDFSVEEAEKLRTEFARIYKEGIDENLSEKVKGLKKMMASDAWAFFIEMVQIQKTEIDNYAFSTYTEKMAYKGHRKEVIEDLIGLPSKVIEYYDALQSLK